MNRLIKAEVFKLMKNKAFKVLCMICVISAFMSIFSVSDTMNGLMKESMSNIPEEVQVMAQTSEVNGSIVTPGRIGFNMPRGNSPLDVYYVSFGVGIIEILIGVLVGGFLAKEYSEGTMKNILAYGKSRTKFYLSKFIAMMVGVSIFTLIITLISFVGTGFMNGFGDIVLADLGKMVMTFLASIMASSAVIALIMIISSLVKGNGATIGITVVLFVLIPTIISIFYGTYPTFDSIYEMTPYYNNALATSQNAETSDLIRSIGISLVTMGLSLGIGTKIFDKQDIK